MAKILVVDDSATSRDAIATLLGDYGHDLLEASDGLEGLQTLRAERPDLVIVDMLMPTMNGYEFISTLRQDAALAAIPVIFYSATFLEKEARALARSCGVTHCITKGAEPEAIVRTVNQALGPDANPPPPLPVAAEREDAVRLMIDAFYDNHQKLDDVSLRLTALLETGLELAEERSSALLLGKFCDASRKIVGAQYAVVGILDSQDQGLLRLHTSGMSPALVPKIQPLLDWPEFISEVMRSRGPHSVFGLEAEPGKIGLPAPFPHAHCQLGIPVQSSHEVYGWIWLLNKLGGDEFSREDEGVLSALTAQAATAYENACRYETLLQQAENLKAEVQELKRAGLPDADGTSADHRTVPQARRSV